MSSNPPWENNNSYQQNFLLEVEYFEQAFNKLLTKNDLTYEQFYSLQLDVDSVTVKKEVDETYIVKGNWKEGSSGGKEKV